jgi:uncharacterized membrane protein
MKDIAPKKQIQFVYGLYAASLLLPFLSIFGLIIAYKTRRDVAGTWLESHRQWLIQTFWISLAGAVVGLFAMFFVLSVLVMMATGLWFLYRIIAGWMKFQDERPIASQLFASV